MKTIINGEVKINYKRTDCTDTLSFMNKPLKTGLHKIHPYPAMLHPLLVNHLLQEYCNNKQYVIFDPFNGSGVTLLQAQLNGYNAFGYDINPLALLISKTKTSSYDVSKLKNEVNLLLEEIDKNSNIDIPNITNINMWFAENIQNELGRIRCVLKNKKFKYFELYLTCFALVCRTHSYTRSGEFKRFRIQEEKFKEYSNKSAIKDFKKNILESINIIENENIGQTNVECFLKNSEDGIHKKFDFVLTSPPYGDSRTTVAYGEFSSFGIEWINDINPLGTIDYKVDKESLGKKTIIDADIYRSSVLLEVLNKIKEIDIKRHNDVLYFFNGYLRVLKNIVKNLNVNGFACFVVGNRIVKGQEILMDQITAEFFEFLGLSFKNILIRNILNKVMPSKNSPTNKVGVSESTMTKEYIVIFKKECDDSI
jgi:DNA modification methylase